MKESRRTALSKGFDVLIEIREDDGIRWAFATKNNETESINQLKEKYKNVKCTISVA